MNLLLTLCLLLTTDAAPHAPHPKCKCTAEAHCGCVDGAPCTCGDKHEEKAS